ncbi:MAG TPA: hypothetical protein VKW78_10160 [Terriglobales bacterium]|nr:hypothetical protein [Terriglobales bacterium]
MGNPAVRREVRAEPVPISRVPQPSRLATTLLSWGSLALATAESLCVAAVGLSGFRVLIGASSLIAATAGGPATGWHRESIRVPFLVAGTIGALLNLLLWWNENRLRNNPAAAWRIRPLTKQQKRRRMIQLVTSVLALLLITAEVITHPWFHHEI